jgi:hypothetical protein
MDCVEHWFAALLNANGKPAALGFETRPADPDGKIVFAGISGETADTAWYWKRRGI